MRINFDFFKNRDNDSLNHDERKASKKMYKIIYKGDNSEHSINELTYDIYCLSFKRTNKEFVDPYAFQDASKLLKNFKLIDYFTVFNALRATLVDMSDNSIYRKTNNSEKSCDDIMLKMLMNITNSINNITEGKDPILKIEKTEINNNHQVTNKSEPNNLTSNEKQVAESFLKRIDSVKNLGSIVSHYESMNMLFGEIALELYKFGVCRINNKEIRFELTNHSVEFKQMKCKEFVDEIMKKLNDKTIFNKNIIEIEEYVKFWILKLCKEGEDYVESMPYE